jgi:chorismate lyase / 3-hydroxybenzoate synthase
MLIWSSIVQHRAMSEQIPTGVRKVQAGNTAEGNRLLRFDLTGRDTDAAGCGLPWLGGELEFETWLAEENVTCGETDGVAWRRAGNLLFLALEQADESASDPADAVEAAYAHLLEVARASGCASLLRAWNYLPAINAGEGDAERYRRFCLGRAAALEAAGYGERELCAGTAIGSEESRLRIYLLCGSSPGINIENPRQVSAYRYPRRYGPRSPSFARATAIAGANDSRLLMISGTASVVGHRTVHVGDVEAQVMEIVRNLDSLLVEAATTLDRPGLREFGDESLMRVYVRREADWPAIEKCLRSCWPQVRLAGLRGDICRSDLLVEIEAVTRG